MLPVGAIPTFAPNLFKAVGGRRLGRSVKDALTDRHWAMLQDVQLRPLEYDRFIWRWSADGQYSVRSAYRAYFVGWTSMAGAKELWRAAVPPKVKFFFWIALHGRLWTAEQRKRHGLQLDVACTLCDQLDETTDHLLCCIPWAPSPQHLSKILPCSTGGCWVGLHCRKPSAEVSTRLCCLCPGVCGRKGTTAPSTTGP